ncbi:uncharacterized protein LOC132760317 [Ruditapes philippinarum]|uniref:uncharacterized protein LOC132760317 n=1 Tax=Ruditapes philippinarum TaxID=129788 RepID=UPI00295AD469|nr:uncharacterized protein LOC132760317 [Ruditapes philippinarum]
MEDKTVDDIVTVTERSTPSYDSITNNEVIKSHAMNENVSEQTNCDYFKERSSTANSPIILHRDLKPENIIVSESLEVVKLCYLGISKLLTINSSATTYAPGMQPGTLIFQAPEILLGSRPASTKSDVWGMAGTLAELFSECPMWGLQEEDEKKKMKDQLLKQLKNL